MAKKKHIYDLDEILMLSILTRVSMTDRQIREELTKLSDGTVVYTESYVRGLLYGLHKDKLIRQIIISERRRENAATEEGKNVLREWLELYRAYDKLLHQPAETVNLPTLTFVRSGDYEKTFNGFLERSAYEDAQGILLTLARSAFKAGWDSALGKSSAL